MPTSARYFDLVREMKNAYNPPTVRKWLRRFQQYGPSGLLEQSRARSQQAPKTPAALEAQGVELRKTLLTFGARRLIRRVRSVHRPQCPGTHLASAWAYRGLLFWTFAQNRSASASAAFGSRIQRHLDRYGVSLRDLV